MRQGGDAMKTKSEKETCYLKKWFTILQSDKSRVCTARLQIGLLGMGQCVHPRPKTLAKIIPSCCSDISIAVS